MKSQLKPVLSSDWRVWVWSAICYVAPVNTPQSDVNHVSTFRPAKYLLAAPEVVFFCLLYRGHVGQFQKFLKVLPLLTNYILQSRSAVLLPRCKQPSLPHLSDVCLEAQLPRSGYRSLSQSPCSGRGDSFPVVLI